MARFDTSRWRPWGWQLSRQVSLSFSSVRLDRVWSKSVEQKCRAQRMHSETTNSIKIPLPSGRWWFWFGIVLRFRATRRHADFFAHPSVQIHQFASIGTKRHVGRCKIRCKRTVASRAFRGKVWFRHVQRITNLLCMSRVTGIEFCPRKLFRPKKAASSGSAEVDLRTISANSAMHDGLLPIRVERLRATQSLARDCNESRLFFRTIPSLAALGKTWLAQDRIRREANQRVRSLSKHPVRSVPCQAVCSARVSHRADHWQGTWY